MRKQLIALALASILTGGLYAQDNPSNPPGTDPAPQASEQNEQMPHMPHHRHGGGWARRKAEEFNRILEKLKVDDPKEYQRIEKLRKTDQEQYFRELRKLYPRYAWAPTKAMKLEKKCWDLGEQYQIARTDEEKEQIKKELEATVKECTEAMLNESRARLEKLTKHLAEMEEQKDEINQRRINFFLETKRPDKKAPRRPFPKKE